MHKQSHVEVIATDGGEVSGSGIYNHGTAVTVIAVPNKNYIFIGWTEDEQIVSENHSYTFIATSNRTLTAVFKVDKFEVILSVFPPEAGKAFGSGNYAPSTLVKVSVQPNEEYKFINWMEGTEVVSIDPEYVFAINANRNLRANFFVNMSICESLMTIFGNAPLEGLSPPNVTVNNRDLSIATLLDPDSCYICQVSPSTAARGLDFVFIDSNNGVYYRNSAETINKDTLLDSRSNIWLAVDKFMPLLSGTSISSGQTGHFEFKETVLYSNKQYSLPDYTHTFDLEAEHPNYPKSEFEYINMFEGPCPVLLLHKPDYGYIIVSHEDLFRNISIKAAFVYEILMQVFLKSYYRTQDRDSWITDFSVDYKAKTMQRHDLKHKYYWIRDLLKNPHYKIEPWEYVNIQTITSDANISSIEIAEDGLFKFEKDSEYQTDPPKGDHISFYTLRNTVAYYKDQGHYRIEEPIEISSEVTETGRYIIVKPFKSTRFGIDLREQQSFRLSELYTEFVLAAIHRAIRLIPVRSSRKTDVLYVDDRNKTWDFYIGDDSSSALSSSQLVYVTVFKDGIAIATTDYKFETDDSGHLILEPAKPWDTSVLYTVHIKQGERRFIFYFVIEEQIDPGNIIANIKIETELETKAYDMRLLGGGLSEKEKPNYNLLDIGHAEGRPYRVGSTMIITLPKRLEPHKELILETVQKYSSSGEYVVLLFE